MTRDRLHSTTLVSPGREPRRDRRRRQDLAKQLIAQDHALLLAQRRTSAAALAAELRATHLLPRSGEPGPATAGRAVLEASGGLTLERAREVAETGVDYLSVGALTHSVKVFDIGFDLSEG